MHAVLLWIGRLRLRLGTDAALSGDALAAQQQMNALGLGLRTDIPQATLDYMERRQDLYPLNQALQLAMASGQASGAVDGSLPLDPVGARDLKGR